MRNNIHCWYCGWTVRRVNVGSISKSCVSVEAQNYAEIERLCRLCIGIDRSSLSLIIPIFWLLTLTFDKLFQAVSMRKWCLEVINIVQESDALWLHSRLLLCTAAAALLEDPSCNQGVPVNDYTASCLLLDYDRCNSWNGKSSIILIFGSILVRAVSPPNNKLYSLSGCHAYRNKRWISHASSKLALVVIYSPPTNYSPWTSLCLQRTQETSSTWSAKHGWEGPSLTMS